MNTFSPLLRDAQLLGIHKPVTKPLTVRNYTNPAVSKFDYQSFNEAIGWPYSGITDKRTKMTTYQIAYHKAIKKYHKILLNKTKKGAFTEAFIRHTALEVFDSYAGHEVIFMAGNKASIALDVMERFNLLFEDNNGFTDNNGKKWQYGDIVLSFSKTNMVLELYNGTKIIGSAASNSGRASPVRGYSDVVAWFLTEAAHTGLPDDYPVLNGLTSLTANRDYGDQILESTPNGKRGFFYDLWNDATDGLKNTFKMGKNDYYTLQYDYKIAVKEGVISKIFIESEKKNPRVNFAQEYCCDFTSSSSSVVQEITEKNLTDKDGEDLTNIL